MPDFTLSPADLATLAQLDEERSPAAWVDEPSDSISTWLRFMHDTPFEERAIYEQHPSLVRQQTAWRNPQDAVTRYEALLKELAPFVEETRRNERALEAIPFISAR